MKAITRFLIALLAVTLLTAAIPPVSAASDKSQSTGAPSVSDLFNLKSLFGNNFKDFNKLVNELTKIERKIVKYFEQRGALAVGTALVDKKLTNNFDGTWHVTIYVTVPSGLTANVYDYTTNLVPIPGTFTPIQPNIIRDNYVEWDGLPAGTYTLEFDAVQVLPGFVSDQVFVHAYAFGGFGGLISNDRGVGWWFDI
jgi:hypothetical protein